jgi:tRNA1(Val) A37 N6-methylase TrmN6
MALSSFLGSKKRLYEFINENLKIKVDEKNKYGEVFTPPKIVDEMLDKLPKKIWRNKNIKILDPCGGVGNFLLCIFVRLFEGLRASFENEDELTKHIIENMLYMVELNPKNYNKIIKIFNNPKNIILDNYENKTKIDEIEFDVIIGNPPFQDDLGVMDNGIRISGAKNKLYERIFVKAMKMLKSDGYLCFLVPTNIFSGNNRKYYDIFLKNELECISLNKKLVKSFKEIQHNICYFVLHKSESNISSSKIAKKYTIIENIDGEINKIKILDRVLNPINNWNKYTDALLNDYLLFEKPINKKAYYVRGKGLNEYNETNGKYKIIYTPTKNLYSDDISLAKAYGISKMIIFVVNPLIKYKIDINGEYGCGPNTIYIPVKNEEEMISLEVFLNSRECKELIESTRATRQYIKIKLFEYLNYSKILRNVMNSKTKKRLRNEFSMMRTRTRTRTRTKSLTMKR